MVRDIIVETAKSSAKATLLDAVEDAVDTVIGDAVDGLLDQAGLELPLVPAGENEANSDWFEVESDEIGHPGTGRTGVR